MEVETKQSFVQEKPHQNAQDPHLARVIWSRHAITELVADDLTRYQVEQALQRCELIENYSAVHRSLPDCLVLGWLTSGRPIHAVIAVDLERDRILVITVYLPNAEEWENDWRTRKS